MSKRARRIIAKPIAWLLLIIALPAFILDHVCQAAYDALVDWSNK